MQRISRLFSTLSDTIQTLLIKNPGEPTIDENFFYLTDLTHGLFEGAYALIYPDGTKELFVSQLEEESAKHTKAELHIYTSNQDLEQQLTKALKTVTHIGINYQRIRHSDYEHLIKSFPKHTFIDISDSLQKNRLIKDSTELSKIQQACVITDKIQNKIPELLHDDMTETELAAEIDYYLQKNGASHPAFETISSFGPHSAEPHYTHGDTKIKPGNLVVCDFGATYQRYNADLTRTFVKDHASAKHTTMHETILAAQQQAFDTIRPGSKAQEIHKKVQTYIDKTEYRGQFIHSTGHALGLLVH
ncbi:MAG: Xaa-Pro peptidase family protein, partial [Candidatus Thermoplasmatota archaeon]|nr:Xaa-Pro peptidase family protein [Candidatus Thermoplasmatota archaeon]